MEREHFFEGYSKDRVYPCYDEKKYLKTEDGKFLRPMVCDKRCKSVKRRLRNTETRKTSGVSIERNT